MKKEEILAGTGVGILTGLLIGLSVSPVVGPVLGAILAFGILWIGYKEHQNLNLDAANEAVIARVRSAIATRLTFFCFSCAAGLLLGVFLRANDTFAPTLESKRDQLINLGFSKDKANEILVQKELQHFVSGEYKHEPATFVSKPESATVLYGFTIPIGMDPSQLDPKEYGNTESCLNDYDMKLGDEWGEATKLLRQIDDEEDRSLALEAIFYLMSQKKEE